MSVFTTRPHPTEQNAHTEVVCRVHLGDSWLARSLDFATAACPSPLNTGAEAMPATAAEASFTNFLRVISIVSPSIDFKFVQVHITQAA
jgi:hypothetical protein